MLFGLFMALTFLGAISVVDAGREDVRAVVVAAFGCNVAWGLVDAVMYLVRTLTDRGRSLTLARSVKAADARHGRSLIASSLSHAGARLVTDAELEAIRGRILALEGLPERPKLRGADLLAAAMVFALVVAATVPVVLPFLIWSDIATAKAISRAVALTMLFLGGFALGRYAGYSSWKVGFLMLGVGSALVLAVIALGG